ncbi:phage protein [Streptococcus pneumoniae]|nr:phage protein [Streptococcus pneumoniae]VPU41024.1 phage protein [Streptococcus pneumoniae]
MNIQGLIERYEKFKANKKKMTSVDLVLKDLRSLDEPEPLPFKLKDVVRRIRGFDPTTQTRWLNDILKELGDDYGSMKYREGYEQGKLEGAWVGNQLKDADKIRRELNKPVIPQFVADWIEEAREITYNIRGAIEMAPNGRVKDWLELKNVNLFAEAWVNGYAVEKEKRYLVKVKGVCGNHETLNCEKHSKKWLFSDREENSLYKTKHTRKELEDAGFSEVFNSPLFEVEEVE